MFVSEYLKNLLKKAGINPDEDKFKDFFSNEALGKLEIPVDAATGIDNNLISLTAAKDNFGPLKNHYTALALNGIDANMESLFDELGLDEDAKTELKLEKSTGKRMQQLIKKAQAAEIKKANADKPDKLAHQKTIDDLHAQMRALQSKAELAETSYAKKEKDLRKSYAIQELLVSHKTTLDKLSPSVKRATLNALISDALQSKAIDTDFDENGNLTLLKKDGSKYYGENNSVVSPAQFVEQLLAKEKLLAVNDSNDKTGSSQTNPQNGQQQIINGNTKTAGEKIVVGQNPVFQELMNGAKKDFKNINGVLQD